MKWIAWQHRCTEGFVLRGWHTSPRGKPLLHVIHGNGFCSRMYEPMLAPLAKDFDVWLSDAQGHGDSDHGGRFVGWNRSAELAHEALTQAGRAFEQVPKVAVGHSFGGVLTALICAAHPQCFERTALLDPVFFSPTMLMGMALGEMTGFMPHTPLARQARTRRAHWPDRQQAKAALQGRGTYKGWSEAALDAFVTHALRQDADGQVHLKCLPSREAEVFSSSPERLWSQLMRVRTPTHILLAKHSFAFVSESAHRWASLNDQVQLHSVAGGHCFMQEHPRETAQLLGQLLRLA